MKLILSTHNVTLTKAIEEHVLARLEKLDHLTSAPLTRASPWNTTTRAPGKTV